MLRTMSSGCGGCIRIGCGIMRGECISPLRFRMGWLGLGQDETLGTEKYVACSFIKLCEIRDLVMPLEPRVHHPDANPMLFDDGSLPLCRPEGDLKGDKDGRKWSV
jgi:hypothetical protein